MSCRGSIRKFVRLFNVKNAMPEINISNFKKVNFKNFPPPSPFPRNLGSIHDTRTRTHTRDTNSNSRFPRIFSLLCTSFYSPFVSFFAHYSFLRIHSRIFKLHVQRFFIFRASVLCWINSRVQSISTLHFCCFLDSGLEINRGNRTFSIRMFHRITIPFFHRYNFIVGFRDTRNLVISFSESFQFAVYVCINTSNWKIGDFRATSIINLSGMFDNSTFCEYQRKRGSTKGNLRILKIDRCSSRI